MSHAFTFVDSAGSPIAAPSLNPSTELLRQKLANRQRRPSAPVHEAVDEQGMDPVALGPQAPPTQPAARAPEEGSDAAKPSRHRRKLDDAARAAVDMNLPSSPDRAARPVASAPSHNPGHRRNESSAAAPPKPDQVAAPIRSVIPKPSTRMVGGDPRELDAAVDAAKAAKAAIKEKRRLELEDRRRELYAWNAALEQQFRNAGTDHSGVVLDGV